jgi:hypothetical protein
MDSLASVPLETVDGHGYGEIAPRGLELVDRELTFSTTLNQ